MSFTGAVNPRAVGTGARRRPRQAQNPTLSTPQERRVTEDFSEEATRRPNASASSCPSSSCGDTEERTESHVRAYTMIAPNEEKRRSIMEKAKAEEANYRQYKENQKMGYVSCGGTVGGASCDAPPASLLRKQRNSTFNSKQKSQQYRDGEKRQEAEEINRKKLQQRRKAESNERQEAERQERLRQDHRRVNSAFLRNLERH